MLCDAFCSHTALPRVKGVHQPRDSAVFFSKTKNHSGNSKQDSYYLRAPSGTIEYDRGSRKAGYGVSIITCGGH